jgi:exodeoxyribonuclease VII large subunit
MNRQVSPPPAKSQAELFPTRDVYTVSRLTTEARILLERGIPALWIEGEVSNFSQPASGHWYFSLKDGKAQVRCAMFRTRNVHAAYTPRDGAHVICRARVSLYEPRGEFQLLIDHVEDAGEGELRRKFELLKAKLQAEGLFSVERKRDLPALPARIGVITSPTGAAIRDILNILRRRFPAIPVLIYPVPVQGAGSAVQIAGAIRFASDHRACDVLIVARGGGSLEDLQAFNEEVVARALAECQIPTVSGIGHEVDVTIADFIADVRAPTPSGAAEIVVPDCRDWIERLHGTLRRIAQFTRRRLHDRRERHKWLDGRLAQCHPGVKLQHQAQRLDDIEQRLKLCTLRSLESRMGRLQSAVHQLARSSPLARLRDLRSRRGTLELRMFGAMRHLLATSQRRFEVVTRALNTVSPLATLERGYAIVTRHPSGELIQSSGQVGKGDHIEARLGKGRLRAVVEDKDE